MSQEHVLITPDNLEKLKRPAMPEPPVWFHELRSPLTFEPVTQDHEYGRKIYIGNSGLILIPRNESMAFEMHFNPNGNTSPRRSDEKDELQNVGIWTLAFDRFLQYYQQNQANEPKNDRSKKASFEKSGFESNHPLTI